MDFTSSCQVCGSLQKEVATTDIIKYCVCPVSFKRTKLIVQNMVRIFHNLIMLEVCCGLCRSFGSEVWIPESRHLKNGKTAMYCNQKRTLLSEYCTLNFTFDQPSHWISLVRTIARKSAGTSVRVLSGQRVSWHLSIFMISLYRGGMLCTLWKAITDFREKHAGHWNLSLLLCREEKISFQHRAGVLSKGLLHFNPVFVYQC